MTGYAPVRAFMRAANVTTGSKLQRKGVKRTRKMLALKDATLLRTKAAFISAKRICLMPINRFSWPWIKYQGHAYHLVAGCPCPASFHGLSSSHH